MYRKVEKYKSSILYLYKAMSLIIASLLLASSASANSAIDTFSIKEDDIVLGNANSKVVVVEYFAPTCTHCVNAHHKIFPVIKERYIDTGKIAYVMREFVGNKQDLDARILARCEGSTEKYMALKDLVLSKQDEWAFGRDYRKSLESFGKSVGISKEEYALCLQDESIIQTLINNTTAAAKLDNFIGTPSFFINGKLLDGKYGVTTEIIIEELEELAKKITNWQMMNSG